MPQAVAAYIKTNNFTEVDLAKRDIIALYEEDFGKIDGSGRAKALYDDIPAQLSRDAARYQVGSAVPEEKPNRITNVLMGMYMRM